MNATLTLTKTTKREKDQVSMSNKRKDTHKLDTIPDEICPGRQKGKTIKSPTRQTIMQTRYT